MWKGYVLLLVTVGVVVVAAVLIMMFNPLREPALRRLGDAALQPSLSRATLSWGDAGDMASASALRVLQQRLDCGQAIGDVLQQKAHFVLVSPLRVLTLRAVQLLLLFNEQRRHDRRKESDERDTHDDDDAANDATPSRVWDDITVADRAQRDDGPPHGRAVVREVLLVDDRDDEACQERDSKRGQGKERKDASISNSTACARADEWLSRPGHPGSVLVPTDAFSVEPRDHALLDDEDVIDGLRELRAAFRIAKDSARAPRGEPPHPLAERWRDWDVTGFVPTT